MLLYIFASPSCVPLGSALQSQCPWSYQLNLCHRALYNIFMDLAILNKQKKRNNDIWRGLSQAVMVTRDEMKRDEMKEKKKKNNIKWNEKKKDIDLSSRFLAPERVLSNLKSSLVVWEQIILRFGFYVFFFWKIKVIWVFKWKTSSTSRARYLQ